VPYWWNSRQRWDTCRSEQLSSRDKLEVGSSTRLSQPTSKETSYKPTSGPPACGPFDRYPRSGWAVKLQRPLGIESLTSAGKRSAGCANAGFPCLDSTTRVNARHLGDIDGWWTKPDNLSSHVVWVGNGGSVCAAKTPLTGGKANATNT
jgi:hypothetical protein